MVRAEVATLVDKSAGSNGVGVADEFWATSHDCPGGLFYLLAETIFTTKTQVTGLPNVPKLPNPPKVTQTATQTFILTVQLP